MILFLTDVLKKKTERKREREREVRMSWKSTFAGTAASFPTKREIRHSILSIGNYVFCPLPVLFFFLMCQFNCYHSCVNECAIQLTHVTYRIALNWSPTFCFSNFRIESWRRRTPVSIPKRRACLLAFQAMFNTRYLTLATTFSVP